MIRTPADYARALLKALAMPVTENNIGTIVAAMRAEQDPPEIEKSATYNPLNLTQTTKTSRLAPGGFSVPIQAYASWNDSVDAARKFFTYQNRYAAILAALERSADPSESLAAWAASPYGWTVTPSAAGWQKYARLVFPSSRGFSWSWIPGALGLGALGVYLYHRHLE
ncbi:MAG: hypothetical protein ACYCPT_02070 [Acidimicrobiales bacterium]